MPKIVIYATMKITEFIIQLKLEAKRPFLNGSVPRAVIIMATQIAHKLKMPIMAKLVIPVSMGIEVSTIKTIIPFNVLFG